MARGTTSRPLSPTLARHSARWLSAFAALAILLSLSREAQANSTIFSNPIGASPCTASAPCWQAGTFGILVGLGAAVGSTGTLKTTANGVGISGLGSGGDIGIGSSSSVNTGNFTESWTGPIDFADAAAVKSNNYNVPNGTSLKKTTITDGVQTSDPLVTTALNDVLNMSNYFKTQSGTNLGTLSGGISIGTATTNGSVQVYNASSINLSSILTIVGGPNDLVIINDAGSAVFGSSVVLSGGITSDQVLFNITGTNANILSLNAAGGSINADIIVRGSYSASNTTVNGRILGGWSTISLGTGFALVAPDDIPETPEPSTWILMFGGMTAMLYAGRRFSHVRR